MEIRIDEKIAPAKQEAPALKSVKPLSYRKYKIAGGIFSEGDYDTVVRAGKGAMNGEDKNFEHFHRIQAGVLAKNAGLSPDLAQAAAIYYPIFRETATIDKWAKSSSDQAVFAEVLCTLDEKAYRDYIIKHPHIFKTQG